MRTARLSAEADLLSLRARVAPTSVPPTVDHNTLADSVARAFVAAQSASRTEPLESRAFSKLDMFPSERIRWHDWAAVLQSNISNANADMHTEMTAVEGKTAVTPNVAVINPDSVARSKSFHFMLTMLVEGPALDIILNSGQGEGYEFWQRLVLEYDPGSRVRAAGSMMEILSHPFTSDTSSFEAFDAKVSVHERRTSKAIDDDVKVGCVLKNMTDESSRDQLVLQSKRLTTCAMVRDEVMDVVQARGATGSSPTLVDALMKGTGKGKGKKGKGEGKYTKSMDDKGKSKGWKNRAKDSGDKSQDSKDSAQRKCFLLRPCWTREELLPAAF